MTEETTETPTIEAYINEHAYQSAMLQHSHDFDTLLGSVREEQTQVRETIRGMYYVRPNRLLDPEKLQKLKEDNLSLYGEVSNYYLDYLKKAAGLD